MTVKKTCNSLGAAKNHPTEAPRSAIKYGTLAVIVIADAIFTIPAVAMTFLLILTPPISAPITKAFVTLHLLNICTKMTLAMSALIDVGVKTVQVPSVETTDKKIKQKRPPKMAKKRRPI